MLSVDQAVDFLIKNNALELGESPWPTYDDGQEIHELDWEQLFPPGRRSVDNWSPQPTQEELAEFENIFGVMPVQPPTSAGQQAQWDICAWYQPIHFFGHDWGIFIKEDCVKRTAFMIARFIDPAVRGERPTSEWFKAVYRAAVYLYFLHEHFHHKIECLGFRLHVIQRTSAFLPYHKLVYSKTKGSDEQLEEALANADCYRRLGTQPYAHWITNDVVKATKAYLKWQFPHDPPGYRMAKEYLNKLRFDAGENVLQSQVREARLKPVQPAGEWDMAPRMTQSFFPITSNIWTVIPRGARSRLPIKKPVMPVRTCSTREMIGLLEQAGYTKVDGGKGSHVKLEKSGSPTMILSGNRTELSPAVAKTALRLLGNFKLHDLPRLVSESPG